MANTFAPFGFRQASGNGSAPTYEQVSGPISSSAGAIYFGDPIFILNTGYLVQADNSAPANGIAGVFVGCKYLSVSQKRTVWSNYWPGSDANGDVTGYYVNDPNAQFIVQVGGSTSPVTQADYGANINLAIGTGNASNGISGAYADQTSIASQTAAFPFRIVSTVTNPPGAAGTDAASGYNYIRVAFNNVTTKQLTGV